MLQNMRSLVLCEEMSYKFKYLEHTLRVEIFAVSRFLAKSRKLIPRKNLKLSRHARTQARTLLSHPGHIGLDIHVFRLGYPNIIRVITCGLYKLTSSSFYIGFLILFVLGPDTRSYL
jgi:hypothetical protein